MLARFLGICYTLRMAGINWLQFCSFRHRGTLWTPLTFLIACGGKSSEDAVVHGGLGGASAGGARTGGSSAITSLMPTGGAGTGGWTQATGGKVTVSTGGSAVGGQVSPTGGMSAVSTGGSVAGGESAVPTGGSAVGGQSSALGGTSATSTGGAATGGTVNSGGNPSTGGSAGTGGASSACQTGFAMNYMTLIFDGTWLCGWSGGVDHYSWLRFRQSDRSFADGGVNFGDAVGSLLLTSPTNCTSPSRLYWLVTEICPNTGFPQQADTVLRLTTPASTTNFDCFRYPSDYCAPDFSSCPSPW